MKKISKIAVFTMLSLILFSTTSCVVLVPEHHDNGKHKGWYKNSHNPHNSSTQKNNRKQGQNQNKFKENYKGH